MSILHAHVITHSSDCDGAYTREHVRSMTTEEQSDPMGDLDFHARMVSDTVNTYSLMDTGTLKVTRNGADISMEWSEQTDEGGINTTVSFCERDTCNFEYEAYRDHRAESMGY